MHSFNAQVELLQLRRQRRIARKRSYQRSRLKRYRAELVALRQAGGSYPELALWLRQHKRLKVAHTTVMRYLQGLPECQPVCTDEPNVLNNDDNENTDAAFS